MIVGIDPAFDGALFLSIRRSLPRPRALDKPTLKATKGEVDVQALVALLARANRMSLVDARLVGGEKRIIMPVVSAAVGILVS